MDHGSKTCFGFKINTMEEKEVISLKSLVGGLKEKYENAVVRKEEEIEEEEEVDEIQE